MSLRPLVKFSYSVIVYFGIGHKKSTLAHTHHIKAKQCFRRHAIEKIIETKNCRPAFPALLGFAIPMEGSQGCVGVRVRLPEAWHYLDSVASVLGNRGIGGLDEQVWKEGYRRKVNELEEPHPPFPTWKHPSMPFLCMIW